MNGILCIDKPQHMTSFDCCALLRRLTGEKKVGHAGTLDPMATGVLPLMFGKATRAIPLLPTHRKCYRAEVQFGLTSDTLDVWGTVSQTGKPYPTLAEIEAVVPQFTGDILQVPPMMSALKKDGVRLYDLARQGIEIEREARPVTIYALTIEAYDQPKGLLTLTCDCSAGTYIRTLCDDMGQALGCGAVLNSLRRTAAAGYELSACLTIEQCRALAEQGSLLDHVLPTETAFEIYKVLTVTKPQATRFQNGGDLAAERLPITLTEGETVRVNAPDGEFIGLGQLEQQSLRILRIFKE